MGARLRNAETARAKLETVKMMHVHSKINAISLNVKINKPKSVDICG